MVEETIIQELLHACWAGNPDVAGKEQLDLQVPFNPENND